jgi:hypothetical protein
MSPAVSASDRGVPKRESLARHPYKPSSIPSIWGSEKMHDRSLTTRADNPGTARAKQEMERSHAERAIPASGLVQIKVARSCMNSRPKMIIRTPLVREVYAETDPKRRSGKCSQLPDVSCCDIPFAPGGDSRGTAVRRPSHRLSKREGRSSIVLRSAANWLSNRSRYGSSGPLESSEFVAFGEDRRRPSNGNIQTEPVIEGCRIATMTSSGHLRQGTGSRGNRSMPPHRGQNRLLRSSG